MPVSNNRKKHKSKVAKFKQEVRDDRKKKHDVMIRLRQEQMMAIQQKMQQQLKPQINGTDVENTDIDVEDFGISSE